MLRLRERIDHHARLMPYALSALSDSSRDVQMAALKLMDDLGAQYEDEHKEELKVQHSLACLTTTCSPAASAVLQLVWFGLALPAVCLQTN